MRSAIRGRLGAVVAGAVLVLPASAAAAADNASGPVISACHVSPIVANLDEAAHFYHDLLGLNLAPAPPAGSLPWDDRPEHLVLHGMPGARLRFIGARMPGVFCGIELVEFDRIDRRPLQRRLQDPGAVMLIVLVRDLDAAFAKLKADGVQVVTTGGRPMAVGDAKTRAVVVKDPDGHFVELAQLNPLPETTAPAGSNVIGLRLRVTVADTDRSVQFYRTVLGLEPSARAFAKNPEVMAMMGLPPTAEYRLSTTTMGTSPLLLEFIQFKGVEGKRIASRVQDPGSYRLQLNVREIDRTVAALKSAGSKVVTSQAEPVAMTFGTSQWRLAVAPDLNNLFLIVQQRLP